MNRHSQPLPLSGDRPEPLFASLTWCERVLLALTALSVMVMTPYTLYSLWSLQQ